MTAETKEKHLRDLEEYGFIYKDGFGKVVIDQEKCQSFLTVDWQGEEFWSAYPLTFPLSSGGSFMAKASNKAVVLMDYMGAVTLTDEHKLVMQTLEAWKIAVLEGKMSGVKIDNFVGSRMWKDLIKSPVIKQLLNTVRVKNNTADEQSGARAGRKFI